MEAAANTISSTGSACSVWGSSVWVVSGAVLLLAAGGQREREGEREEQRYELFHGFLFPFKIVLYRYPS